MSFAIASVTIDGFGIKLLMISPSMSDVNYLMGTALHMQREKS